MSSVSLTMPNQHRILVNLQPFGMANANEIFVATSEPFGLIKGTVDEGVSNGKTEHARPGYGAAASRRRGCASTSSAATRRGACR